MKLIAAGMATNSNSLGPDKVLYALHLGEGNSTVLE